jgi:C-terminal peptidase prc
MKNRRISFVIVLSSLQFLLAGCAPHSNPQTVVTSQRDNQEYLFAQEFLYAFFIFPDSLPKDTFGFATPQALYKAVQEPWTLYFPPDSAKLFLSFLTTQHGGMGILIDSMANGYLIRQVFPNSPAQTAGLLAGDTIVSVNGVLVAGVRYDDFGTIVSGNIGDGKTVHVLRQGGPATISVTLGTYRAPSVFTDSLDSTTAYIYLSIFSSETDMPGGTAEEMDSALFATPWAPYTIHDRRGCPGGDLDQCVDVCGRFVPNRTPLIRIHERLLDTVQWTISLVDTELVSSFSGANVSRKFVLLVDSNSASAAEILTSCLMDNRPDIATMGSRTYGKARGQVINITPDSALVKVTYALLTPVTGASYDLVGIRPGIVVPADSSPVVAAMALIAQNTGATKRLAAGSLSREFAIGRISALLKEYGRAGLAPMAYKKMRARQL